MFPVSAPARGFCPDGDPVHGSNIPERNLAVRRPPRLLDRTAAGAMACSTTAATALSSACTAAPQAPSLVIAAVALLVLAPSRTHDLRHRSLLAFTARAQGQESKREREGWVVTSEQEREGLRARCATAAATSCSYDGGSR